MLNRVQRARFQRIKLKSNKLVFRNIEIQIPNSLSLTQCSITEPLHSLYVSQSKHQQTQRPREENEETNPLPGGKPSLGAFAATSWSLLPSPLGFCLRFLRDLGLLSLWVSIFVGYTWVVSFLNSFENMLTNKIVWKLCYLAILAFVGVF